MSRTAYRFFLWLGLLGVPLLGQAQARLNLALEPEANHYHPLLLWSTRNSAGPTLQFDSATVHQGRGSLRLDLPAAEVANSVLLFTLFSFPVDSVRGRQVTVSAWLHTGDFQGQAGIYAYAHIPDDNGKNRLDKLETLPAYQPWQRLEVTLPVKALATAFGIGLQVRGRGRIWFDDVQVRIDGRLFQDAPQLGTEALLLTPAEVQQLAWDGEHLPPLRARPDSSRVQLTLDSLQPQQGRRNLRVALPRPPRPNEPRSLVYLGTLPAEKIRGKLLTVTGYWQQDAPPVSTGHPSGPAGQVAPDFTYTLLGNDGRPGSPPQWSRGVVALPTSPPGSAWTPFSLTIPVPDDEFLYGLSLGLRPGSSAPLRLDNLRFLVDGRLYLPASPPPPAPPTPAEIAWLRSTLVPLPALAPSSALPLELSKLGPLIGSAQLVGLGEVTHGSGSIFALKHQVIRYLVEQKGFTGVLLETSADCGPLNSYLRTGQGDPDELLASLGVWNTQEVLDLVHYLRTYNEHHRLPVCLVGIDIQAPEFAVARLQQATRATDTFARARLLKLTTALAQLPRNGGGPTFDLFTQPNQPDDALLQPLLQIINELRTGVDTRAKLLPLAALPPRDQAAYLHDLRLVEQGAIFRRLPIDRAGAYRDACLAENIVWLQQHLGDAGATEKLVVWAHNAHVATAAHFQHPMGEWLKATFGKAYVAVGFAFGQGAYAAEGNGKFHIAQAQPTRAGTYEAWFQATGIPLFALDLRPITANKAGKWLTEQQLFRDIGIQEATRNFAPHNLSKEFDILLFLQHSIAAQHLK